MKPNFWGVTENGTSNKDGCRRLGTRRTRFLEIQREPHSCEVRCGVQRDHESYASVLAKVREKYRLDAFLLPSEPELLTYDFPDWMKGHGEYGAPPLEIRNNNNVELFMAVRLDCVWLELYVTYGSVDVDLYRRQRAEEDAGDLRGGLDRPPRPVPWRGDFSRSRYFLNSSP